MYAPQDDTALLAETVRREPAMPGAQVLDVGTGTGALALLAARCGAAGVEAVDVSARAVLTAWLNARLSGEPVRVRLGGLACRGHRAALRRRPGQPALCALAPSGGRFERAGAAAPGTRGRTAGRCWTGCAPGRRDCCARGGAAARAVRAERRRNDAGAAGRARGCTRM